MLNKSWDKGNYGSGYGEIYTSALLIIKPSLIAVSDCAVCNGGYFLLIPLVLYLENVKVDWFVTSGLMSAWSSNKLVRCDEVRWLWPNLDGDDIDGGGTDLLGVGRTAMWRNEGADEQLVDRVWSLLLDRERMASKLLQSNSSSSTCFHLNSKPSSFEQQNFKWLTRLYRKLYLLRQDLIKRVIIAAVPAVIQARSNQRRTPSTHKLTGLGRLLSAKMMVGKVRFFIMVPCNRWVLKLRVWTSKKLDVPVGCKAAIGSFDMIILLTILFQHGVCLNLTSHPLILRKTLRLVVFQVWFCNLNRGRGNNQYKARTDVDWRSKRLCIDLKLWTSRVMFAPAGGGSNFYEIWKRNGFVLTACPARSSVQSASC